MFWFIGPEACGILVPCLEIKPAPPALEGKALTTGPPEKPLPNVCLSSQVHREVKQIAQGHTAPCAGPWPPPQMKGMRRIRVLGGKPGFRSHSWRAAPKKEKVVWCEGLKGSSHINKVNGKRHWTWVWRDLLWAHSSEWHLPCIHTPLTVAISLRNSWLPDLLLSSRHSINIVQWQGFPWWSSG